MLPFILVIILSVWFSEQTPSQIDLTWPVKTTSNNHPHSIFGSPSFCHYRVFMQWFCPDVLGWFYWGRAWGCFDMNIPAPPLPVFMGCIHTAESQWQVSYSLPFHFLSRLYPCNRSRNNSGSACAAYAGTEISGKAVSMFACEGSRFKSQEKIWLCHPEEGPSKCISIILVKVSLVAKNVYKFKYKTVIWNYFQRVDSIHPGTEVKCYQ